MAGGKSGLIKLMVLFCKINMLSIFNRWKPILLQLLHQFVFMHGSWFNIMAAYILLKRKIDLVNFFLYSIV